MSAEAVIDVANFSMSFGKTRVIEDLSFGVQPGETFGLLGSNGCGKTTTIRALLDIYTPTSGTLLINGKRFSPRAGATLGYLPEERGLYRKEPVIEVMTYFGQLKQMSRAEAKKAAGEFLEKVGLSEHASTGLHKLSGGQQQKVQLGVTVLNRPKLLILDEPTKGFDPVNRRLLMDIIEEQRREGATIVIITHQMEEVERLCDRILLLKDGRARAYGTIADVQDEFEGARLQVAFSGSLPAEPVSFTARINETNYAELEIRDGASGEQVLRELLDAGVEIRKFESSRISLEEVFLRVYGTDTEVAA